jgi:hypothetical protein
MEKMDNESYELICEKIDIKYKDMIDELHFRIAFLETQYKDMIDELHHRIAFLETQWKNR